MASADIQGMRAIAVLMVIGCHAGLPISGGFAGVDVFFVVSGFVITAMLVREWRATGRIDLAQFYLRRALRLIPALAVLVAFVMLAAGVVLSPFGPQQTAARTGVGALLFAANFVIAHSAGDYFAPAAAENPLLHTWSLSLEEQFYLIFPAALIGALSLGRALGRPTLVPVLLLGAASLSSFALAVAWIDGSGFADGLTDSFGGPEIAAFYGLPTRIWEFGVGGLLALASARGYETSRAFREWVGALGLGLIVGSAVRLDGAAGFPGWLAVLPVAGTALLLLAGAGTGSTVSRMLSARPLVVIGDGSYSLYLWHWPLIVLAETAFPDVPHARMAGAAFAILPAWLVQQRVENPLRVWRPRAAFAAARVLLAIAAAPIAIATGLIVGASSDQDELALRENGADSVRSEGRRPITRAWRSAHALVAAGCVNTKVDPVRCRFGPHDAKGTILLLGDSQAYAIGDGLIAAARELGYSVVASSQTGCPFLGRGSTVLDHPDCPAWQRHALEHALASRPAAVVIANRSAGYVHPERGWLTVVDDRGRRARTAEEAVVFWRSGLEDVVARLRDARIPVLIVASVPEMPRSADQRSIFAQAFGGRSIGVSLAEVVADRRPAYEAERAVTAGDPAATVFDPLPALCNEVCASAGNGTIHYQDATHLSVDGALLLAPGLRTSLQVVLQSDVASL